MRDFYTKELITQSETDWNDVYEDWRKFWKAWNEWYRSSVRQAPNLRQSAMGNTIETLIPLFTDKNKLRKDPQLISKVTALQPKSQLVTLIPHLNQITQRLSIPSQQGNGRTVSPKIAQTFAATVIECVPASPMLVQAVIDTAKKHSHVAKVIFKPKRLRQKINEKLFPMGKVGDWSEVANGRQLVTLLLQQTEWSTIARVLMPPRWWEFLTHDHTQKLTPADWLELTIKSKFRTQIIALIQANKTVKQAFDLYLSHNLEARQRFQSPSSDHSSAVQMSSLSSSSLSIVDLSVPPSVPLTLNPKRIIQKPLAWGNDPSTAVVVTEPVVSMPVSTNVTDVQTPLKPPFASKPEVASPVSTLPDDADRDFEILDQLGSISARKPSIESPLRGNTDPFNGQFAEQERKLSRGYNEKMRKILFADNNPSLISDVDSLNGKNSTALGGQPGVESVSTGFSGEVATPVSTVNQRSRGNASTTFSGVNRSSPSSQSSYSHSLHTLTQMAQKWQQEVEEEQAKLPFVPSLVSTRCSFVNEQQQLTRSKRDNSPQSQVGHQL